MPPAGLRRSVSCCVLPFAVRKSGLPFLPAMPEASRYAAMYSSRLWCAGMSWRFPPFSCNRTYQHRNTRHRRLGAI